MTVPKRRGEWNVVHAPRAGLEYLVAADIGLGMGGTDSAAVVFNRTLHEGRYIQHAAFVGQIDTWDFADELDQASQYYGGALISPERNGLGDTVVKKLYRQCPRRLMSRSRYDPTTRQYRMVMGYQTTEASKLSGYEKLAMGLADDIIELTDPATIRALEQMELIENKGGDTVPQAVGGRRPPDLYMALIISCDILLTQKQRSAKDVAKGRAAGVRDDSGPIPLRRRRGDGLLTSVWQVPEGREMYG